MNRKQRLSEIRAIAACLESLCNRHCDRELRELQQAACRTGQPGSRGSCETLPP